MWRVVYVVLSPPFGFYTITMTMYYNVTEPRNVGISEVEDEMPCGMLERNQ
jgi:hypothetical protein